MIHEAHIKLSRFVETYSRIDRDTTEETRIKIEYSPFLKAAPQPPQNLSVASVGETTVDLDWDDLATPFDDYTVYVFNNTTGSQEQKITGIVLSEVQVMGLTTDNDYEFWVVSVRDGIESAESNHVMATPTDTTAPSVPTGLAATAGDTEVALNWDDNAEPDLAGYNVYVDGVAHAGNPYLVSEATITGLTNGQSYDFQVSAFDDAGNESALSAIVSATPESPVTNTHSLSFDGVNDYVDIGALTFYQINDWRVKLYVKWDGVSEGYLFSMSQAISGSPLFALRINSGIFKFVHRDNGGTLTQTDESIAVGTGVWYKVEATYDGSTITLIVDDVVQDTIAVADIAGSSTYNETTMACLITGSLSQFASVKLDEVEVYSAGSLVHQWRFEEGSGSTANDSVGTAHGTINGAVYSTDVPFS